MHVIKKFIRKIDHFLGAYLPPIISGNDAKPEGPGAILFIMGPDADHIAKGFGSSDYLHFSAANKRPTSTIR